ncbi:MAG: RHS repeat-associated core domain-containing protein, partial [Pseudomonadota bacterium]
LCQATTSTGYNRVHYYDSLGRPSETNTTIDTTYVDRTTYDAAGRIATRVYPGGFTAKYVYTALGYLKELRNGVTDALYWRANTLDAEGRLGQQEYGNGVITQQGFDAATGRLVNIYAGPGNSVQNLALQYDSIGNVVSRQDATQNVTETFLYDNLNRLTSATVNSSAAGVVTTDYAYDVLGNLICKSDLGACSGSAPNYTYRATAPLPGGGTRPLPHAVSYINASSGGSGIGGAYQYDGNGNVVVFGNAYTIAYTSSNLVSRISTSAAADFWYGPERQRIRMYASWTGTRNVYYLHPDNQNGLFYEKAVTATTQYQTEHTYYLTAAGQTVAAVVQGDTGTSVRYFHRDHLGSLVAITDDTGTVIERFGYEPFGKRRYPDGTSDPTTTISSQYTYRGFTNHEHLSEVGLIHMNGRVFHPAIGRFMSADPYVQVADNLQSYNRYSYTFNNPLTYTDPSGYFNLGKFLGIDKVVRTVTDTVKSIIRNPVKAVAVVTVAYFTGQYVGNFLGTAAASAPTYSTAFATWAIEGSTYTLTALGSATVGASAGFAASLVGSGGDLKAGLQGALSGGVLGGLTGISGDWDAVARAGARATVSGLLARVQGGNFGEAFRYTLVSSAVAEGYRSFVGWAASPASGESRPAVGVECQLLQSNCYVPDERNQQIPRHFQNRNAVGLNNPLSGIGDDVFRQSGPLSMVLNVIPGLNATAQFHDTLFTREVLPFNLFTNVATIPPAAVFTYTAIRDQLPVDKFLCPQCYR